NKARVRHSTVQVGKLVYQSQRQCAFSVLRIVIHADDTSSQTSLSRVDCYTSSDEAKSDDYRFHFALFKMLLPFKLSATKPSIRVSASSSFSTVQHKEILMNRLPRSPKMNPGVMNTLVP